MVCVYVTVTRWSVRVRGIVFVQNTKAFSVLESRGTKVQIEIGPAAAGDGTRNPWSGLIE
jgi:type II secretory pathway component PulC